MRCLKGQTLIQNKPSVSEGYFSASLEKALFCGLSWILTISILCVDFFNFLVFDTLRIKQVPQSLINTGMVALYAVCMKYSNVLSLLTFFLNSFHFPFCYKLIVRPESTCLMKVIRYLLALIYRHKSLFFYICKFYVS